MADKTKKEQEAINRKRKATIARNKRAKAGTPAKRRKKRTTKPKGALSEMFNPKMAQAGGKSTISGGIGGLGYSGLYKMMPNATPLQRLLAGFAASFITSTVIKLPNVGAGISGGATALLMQEQGYLDEGGMTGHKYANDIESLPMVLDENGEELYLQERGDDMYLQENDDMYLQDDMDYGVGYYQDGDGFGTGV